MITIDLEQEFCSLMRTLIKQIDDKCNSGELTAEEAQRLTEMVEERSDIDILHQQAEQRNYGWSHSGCSFTWKY